MTDPSSLAAALADIDRFTEQHMPPWSVIVAAARERLRLSKIPCETCSGSGKVAVSCKEACKINHSRPCDSCGGSGEVWGEALLLILNTVIVDSLAAALNDAKQLWPTQLANVSVTVLSRAILDALDLWMKAAK